jgi:precorrin-3B synthase
VRYLSCTADPIGAVRKLAATMTRSRDDDACPGALSVHDAADGALARIRLPGGMVTAGQVTTLAAVAGELGSGVLELTSRGNVQIRGITDPDAVAAAIAAAGLLPSPTHERVRNIVASPLSGRSGGIADVRGWVPALDAALCADATLAALPGRFLFGIDDGRGDISGLGADVGVHVVDGDTVALLLAGRDTGVRLPHRDAVAALLAVAARFTRHRDGHWRIGELADTGSLLDGFTPTAAAGGTWPAVTRPLVGWGDQDDGGVTLAGAVPLGVLPARLAELVGAVPAPIVVTPWRSLLICDLDEATADTVLRVLAPMGLIYDESSPLLDVSACTGAPGCAHAVADVRADAALAAAEPADVHRHFVGCERGCGSPPAGEVLVATPEGYRLLRPAP